MIVVPTHNAVFFDVDQTLVLWDATPEQMAKDSIVINCPKGYVMVDDKPESVDSWQARIVPHRVHIEQLMKHKLRGHIVVVWSAGGWDWAESAVKALGLEDYVDLVISKPVWAYDDLDPVDYMPKSKWLENK